MVVYPITTGDVDKWAWVKIGEQFPENPVRVKGEQNQYPALWYKNGKPVFGRAWNDGGVVECSFPYSGRELTGATDLGGQIQILTYSGHIDSNKFEYKWVPWAERDGPTYALLRCGQATSVVLPAKSGNRLAGNLDLVTETATAAEGGKEERQAGPQQIASLLVIVREHYSPGGKPINRENQWKDLRIHDPTPTAYSLLLAGGKKINTGDGRLVEHNVALWYKHGEPVFGRCWTYKGDMIEASFGILGKEFTGLIGSIQVLAWDDRFDNRFQYGWIPFRDCVAGAGEWKPVAVKDVAPCLITNEKGAQKLGCVWLSKGIASTGWAGLEEKYTGGIVSSFPVLARKELP